MVRGIDKEVSKRPFLFLLIPLLLGILSGRYSGITLPYYIPFLPILLSILSYILRRYTPIPPLIALSLFALAMVRSERAVNPAFPEDHIFWRAGEGWVVLEGVVYRVEELISKERLSIEVDRIFLDGDRPARGRVLLTIGDRDGVYSPGQRVRFRAKLRVPEEASNPGEFDYRDYLASKGIYVTAYSKGSGWVVPVGEVDGYGGVRGRIRSFLDGLEPPFDGLVRALILGERRGVERDVRDLFIRTGTAHLLAISGLHIGIIAFTFYTLALSILKRSEYILLAMDVRKVAALIAVPAVVWYSFIGGFSIPTQRAMAFSILFFLSLFIGRDRDYYNLLAFAAFLILLYSPLSLFHASFQLSFVAVLSILIFSPILGRGRGMGGRLGDLMLISIVTSMGTLPILLDHFYRVSTVGVVANLVAVPLIGFIALPFLLMGSFVSLLSESLASYAILPGLYALDIGLRWLSLLSALPWAYIPLPPFSTAGMILYYVAFAGLALAVRIRKAALLLVLPFLLWLIHGGNGGGKGLSVTFMSVGYGDSILVEFPNGKRMLVDGGGGYGIDPGERVVAPLLWRKGIGRIDYLVLTGLGREHVRGLFFIARNFEIGEFIWNGERRGDVERLLSILEEKGVKIRAVDRTTPPFEVGEVRVEVLHPPRAGYGGEALVMKLLYGDVSFILSGDLRRGALLLEGGIDLGGTILKLPGHGGKGSWDEGLLRAVAPEVAILSTRSKKAYQRQVGGLREEGIEVLRTDREGAITIITDGKGFRIDTYRGRDG